MAKRRNYTDKFKAGAIAMLESEGYPTDAYALERVAQQVKVPTRTLRRWYKGETGAPTDEIVQETKKALSDLIETEIRAALGELPNARPDASYRDIVTGIGILVDKKQLLDGGATSRDEHLGTISLVEVVRTPDDSNQ